MFRVFILITYCLSVAVNGKECETCEGATQLPVCGSDGRDYPTFCDLMRTECVEDRLIGFECDGKCPCDPEELRRLDEKTVNKLAELRRNLQLEDHIPDLEDIDNNNSDDIVTLEILDNNEDIKNFQGEEDRGYVQTISSTDRCSLRKVIGNCRGYFPSFYYDGVTKRCIPFVYGGCHGNDNRFHTQAQCMDACHSKGCPDTERIYLPSRLIDWFHVLRANEQEQKNKVSGVLHEPVLKEMNFMDGKLKAMYSRLACADNDDQVEREVCLEPVKWMFKNLDKDGDNALSPVELLEIEELNNEHCIKPFLNSCDRDNNKKVVLKEFCRCLCTPPPCTHVLENIPTVVINGRANPYPGKFTPKCDQDGFFMPRQVNILKDEQWCVDRNGAEFSGTRRKMNKELHCDVNTRSPRDTKPLIPLDVQKEDEKQE